MKYSTPFVRCQLTMSLPLPPAYIGRELEGARAGLDELLTRYHPGIGGVLIAYSNLFFPDSKPASTPANGGGSFSASHARLPMGRIVDELPFVHVRVRMTALVFRPRLGQILRGTIVSQTSSNVGVLVAGLFNASILPEDLETAYSWDESSQTWISTGTEASSSSAVASTAAASSASINHNASSKKRRRSSAAGEDVQLAGPPANRILAMNPTVLMEGADVSFRLTRLGFAYGIMQMFGCFADGDRSEPLPSPNAGAEGSSGGSGATQQRGQSLSAKRRRDGEAASIEISGGAVSVEEEAPQPIPQKSSKKKQRRDAIEEDGDGGAAPLEAADAVVVAAVDDADGAQQEVDAEKEERRRRKQAKKERKAAKQQ